jgi:hypothetical protein
MFLPFNNKEKSEQGNGDSFQNKVAAGIVQKCIKVQLQGADFMRRKTEGLSCKWVKFCLLLFCLVSLGCSLYLVLGSFHGSGKTSLHVTSIDVPVNATKTGEEETLRFLTITKAELERIERFKRYLDSLGGSENGKRLRSNILLSRPRLMDSIRFVEKLYQLQSPKN